MNPEIKHGLLPNGLTYHILHKGHLKDRDNFYIVQKAGSAFEMPEQYGGIHFLEYMALNGTRYYPGDFMLHYLESNQQWDLSASY